MPRTATVSSKYAVIDLFQTQFRDDANVIFSDIERWVPRPACPYPSYQTKEPLHDLAAVLMNRLPLCAIPLAGDDLTISFLSAITLARYYGWKFARRRAICGVNRCKVNHSLTFIIAGRSARLTSLSLAFYRNSYQDICHLLKLELAGHSALHPFLLPEAFYACSASTRM